MFSWWQREETVSWRESENLLDSIVTQWLRLLCCVVIGCVVCSQTLDTTARTRCAPSCHQVRYPAEAPNQSLVFLTNTLESLRTWWFFFLTKIFRSSANTCEALHLCLCLVLLLLLLPNLQPSARLIHCCGWFGSDKLWSGSCECVCVWVCEASESSNSTGDTVIQQLS